MNNKIVKSFLKKIKNANPKVLIMGDVMLDHYVHGNVKRISPEAPVPILSFNKDTCSLGGAANVAHNSLNLGADVTIASLIGNDSNGEIIKDLFRKYNINTELLFSTGNINTTKKTRFLSTGIQMLRLDEDSNGLKKSDLDFFQEKVLKKINNFDYIIISDYNKGICESSLVRAIIEAANIRNISTYVDPKGHDWGKYTKATCITPNTKEAEELFNLSIDSDLDFEHLAVEIKNKYKLKSCLITRGSEGMTFLSDENRIFHQRVGEKEVFDVSGAGDTVIACISAAFNSGLTSEDSLKLSSFVSSEVVTHIGTVPFNNSMVK